MQPILGLLGQRSQVPKCATHGPSRWRGLGATALFAAAVARNGRRTSRAALTPTSAWVVVRERQPHRERRRIVPSRRRRQGSGPRISCGLIRTECRPVHWKTNSASPMRQLGCSVGGGPRSRSGGDSVPRGRCLLRAGDATKILLIGNAQAIDRDINQSKPRRKHARHLDTRSARACLESIDMLHVGESRKAG